MSPDLPQRRPRTGSPSGPKFAAAAVGVYDALVDVRLGVPDPLLVLEACAQLVAPMDPLAPREVEAARGAVRAGAAAIEVVEVALQGILRRLEDVGM